jgi:hypothetical protein
VSEQQRRADAKLFLIIIIFFFIPTSHLSRIRRKRLSVLSERICRVFRIGLAIFAQFREGLPLLKSHPSAHPVATAARRPLERTARVATLPKPAR